jgi:hypothetical protein
MRDMKEPLSFSILLIVQKVIIIMHFAVEAILFFLHESVSVLSCILLPRHNLCLSKIISFLKSLIN